MGLLFGPDMDLTLVILAAGLSTRYGQGLKQADGVGPSGEYLWEYAVHDAARAGFGRVVLVIRPGLEPELSRRVGFMAGDLEVVFAVQALDAVPPTVAVPDGRRKPWGTGHAVLAAAPAVSSPFVVVNADDFYGAAAYEAIAAHLRRHASTAPPQFAMAGYRLASTLSAHGGVSRAIVSADARGLVSSVVEVVDIATRDARLGGRTLGGEAVSLTGDELVSMNCWGFTPAIFPMLREGFARFLRTRGTDPAAEFVISDEVGALVAAGEAQLHLLPSGDEWCGMTAGPDRDDVRRRLAALVAAGRYPSPLFQST